MLLQALCIISKPSLNWSLSYSPETLNSGQNRRFFVPCDVEIDELPWITIGHLFYIASSFVHQATPTAVTVWKCPIWVKIDYFLPVWPRNLMYDLEKYQGTYTTSSFVHHFKSIGEFKLKLDSSQNWRFFVPCGFEIWWMTFENKKATLLYYTKLCASFKRHGWIHTGVTIWKPSIKVKVCDFLSRVTLKFDGWPWKRIGHFYLASSFVQNFIAICEFQTPNLDQNRCFLSHVTLKFDRWPWKTIVHLFYATSSFVHHFVAIGEFKLDLQSGNSQFGSESTIFEPCDLKNLTDDFEKQKGTSPKQHQAVCIILSYYVNSNWRHGPETAK